MRIKLTEGQLERIKSITEGNDKRYNKEISVDFNYHNVTYKGREINDIIGGPIRLMYDIEVEGRSWGIKSISLYGIIGPSEYEIEVEYFVDEDNTDSVTIPVKLDWSNLQTDEINEMRFISIGDSLQINLANDANGNIFVKEMSIDIYSL